MSSKNLRLLCAHIINEVQNGRSLQASLAARFPSLPDARDRGFLQSVCYGVCRFYTRLEAILNLLVKKPLRAKDSDVYALLLVGLYQLMDTQIPAHASVAETVNAALLLKKPWARGFVNAILREYQRRQIAIDAQINEDSTALFAHPLWWIEAIKKAWPYDWQAILTANNAHPPFALRVNQLHVTREQYLQQLAALNLVAHAIPETANGIILESAIPVKELPGFSAGVVSVQDGAAGLAAELLQLSQHQTVLDACAAPGGKLTHILEREPKLSVCIALDNDRERMQSIKENLARLKLQAECMVADANDVKSWWDGKLFDRILLDAPCSASGVIRRHPDIKLLRRQTDIHKLANTQLALLTSLWTVLKPGGILLYATCSIFPEENEALLARFLATHADAKESMIDEKWGVARAIGRQILPGMHNMDGFYYARLEKKFT